MPPDMATFYGNRQDQIEDAMWQLKYQTEDTSMLVSL